MLRSAFIRHLDRVVFKFIRLAIALFGWGEGPLAMVQCDQKKIAECL